MAPSDTETLVETNPVTDTNVAAILASIVERLDRMEAKPARAPKAPAAPAPGSVTTDGKAYRVVEGPMPAGCLKWITTLGMDGITARVARVERGYLVEIGSSSTITDTVAEAKLLLRGAVLLSMHLTPTVKA